MVDSSAWIEYLRGTGSPQDREVDRLLGEEIAITEPIVMEILAGGRSDEHLHKLQALLARAELVPVRSADYMLAASLFRTCRQHGDTVRKMIDCLIAAVAVRRGVPVLNADSDFGALARWTSVREHQL